MSNCFTILMPPTAATMRMTLSSDRYIGVFRGFIAIVALCSAALATCLAQPAAPSSVVIDQATLTSLVGQRVVELPNVLEPEDFAPQGSLVRYRLSFYLDQKPEAALGVYVPKMSVSGTLRINGHDAASCGIGPLEDLRCLHQPQFFVIPSEFWRVGANTLDFDIYATERQMNGLSRVTIGDPAVLGHDYRLTRWLKSDLLVGLAWLSLLSGFLSLSVAVLLRRQPVYFWFGLTSISNAFALFNSFVERPIVPIDIYNCLVFSARLISVPMLFATFLAIFGKSRRWFSALVMAFCIAAPIAIWLSDNNRTLVLILYTPWVIVGAGLTVAMLYWAWQAKQRLLWGCALAMPLLTLTGIIDWMRTGGQTRFEGILLVAYASTTFLIILWVMIVNGLVRSVEQERAKDRVRAEERTRLLQDMHDGFGSQLAGLSLLAEKGRIQPAELPQYLNELMADLYLMVDTLGPGDVTFEEALIDMRYRLQNRFKGVTPVLDWDISLDGMPGLGQRTVLHLLRIMQEAINNVLKHARATRVAIRAVYDSATAVLTICIHDNGCGLPDSVVYGRGLYNMQVRAREAGAELRIENAQGVEVCMHLETGRAA